MDIGVSLNHGRLKVIKADQSNPDHLEMITGVVQNAKFIIDDGSHHPVHQLESFQYLFKNLLEPGGIYIIEDIECNYWNPKESIYGYQIGYFMQYLKDFAQFYLGRMQQQAAGLKAQKALQLRQQKMKDMPLFLKQMQKPLAAMMAFYKEVIALKNLTLAKLNKATAIGTFAQTDAGLEVTDPEGFVAVGTAGDAVKLVDRLGFSRKNLTAISKFQKA